ncbi:hypothetical protein [Actinoplanes teichomyceticus]|uniref:4-hydroxybenzoate polyprenyltransferase n=1 Tax=Actinoplanes teichomyceticus TaxID=1867 RepID=A0A561WML3_ACTTI|nr:hypothetical protein [Actinoplanes teichomyceticus]TWG25101.1 4-hydroxybenzoate polyprenyltransferase [Actinoplanes teichomyceticus]GIF10173.1 hypothetical protein Ate01nite_02050 [Actinoplanes teichomyceticus]
MLSRAEVHGAKASLPVRTLAATAAVAGLAGSTRPGPGTRLRRTLVPAALAGWYAARYGAVQAAVIGDPSAARVRAAVGAGITTLPVLQGALTARQGAVAAGAATACVAELAARLARAVSPT